jgi:DNA-binding MarR family transcriptional regulator
MMRNASLAAEGIGPSMPVVDGMPELSMSLFLKLRTFNMTWNRRLTEFLRESWKLEVNEALALIVAENNPLTGQADIGVHLNLHPNVMVVLARRLRKRRLIAIKEHPHDGRKLIITLTPHGLEIVREIRSRYPEILDQVISLGPADRRRLDDLVTLIVNSEVSHKTSGTTQEST